MEPIILSFTITQKNPASNIYGSCSKYYYIYGRTFFCAKNYDRAPLFYIMWQGFFWNIPKIARLWRFFILWMEPRFYFIFSIQQKNNLTNHNKNFDKSLLYVRISRFFIYLNKLNFIYWSMVFFKKKVHSTFISLLIFLWFKFVILFCMLFKIR